MSLLMSGQMVQKLITSSKIFLILLVLAMVCPAPTTLINAGTAPNKKPAQVFKVRSVLSKYQYAIVETVIYHDIAKGAGSAPIITRSQRGIISPNRAIIEP